MNSISGVALLIAALTAVWFGLVAYHYEKGIVAAAVAGALVGLVVSGICLGLGSAVNIPYTQALRSTAVVRAGGVALGIIGLIGAAFTALAHKASGLRAKP